MQGLAVSLMLWRCGEVALWRCGSAVEATFLESGEAAFLTTGGTDERGLTPARSLNPSVTFHSLSCIYSLDTLWMSLQNP